LKAVPPTSAAAGPSTVGTRPTGFSGREPQGAQDNSRLLQCDADGNANVSLVLGSCYPMSVGRKIAVT
jgi:hypothetical protein